MDILDDYKQWQSESILIILTAAILPICDKNFVAERKEKTFLLFLIPAKRNKDQRTLLQIIMPTVLLFTVYSHP